MSKRGYSQYYRSITANEEHQQPQSQAFFGNQVIPNHHNGAFFQAKLNGGSYSPFFNIQRCACDSENETLQKQESESSMQTASPAAIENRLRGMQGKGKPMPQPLLGNMESSFGADFSGVNIHADEEAAEMNSKLGAQAFTTGNDIFFNRGKYNPDANQGKELLAHELTHTIQQGQSAPVNGNAPNGTVQRFLEEPDCDKKDKEKEGSKEEAKANETTTSKGHCIETDKPVEQPPEDQEKPDTEEQPKQVEANEGAGVDERQSHAPPAEENAPDKEKNVKEEKDKQPPGPCDPQPGQPGGAAKGGAAGGGAGGAKGGGPAAAPTAKGGHAGGGDAAKAGAGATGGKGGGKEEKKTEGDEETGFLQAVVEQGVSSKINPEGLGEDASPGLKAQRDEISLREQTASAELESKDSAVTQLTSKNTTYLPPPGEKGNEKGDEAIKDHERSTVLANAFMKDTGRRLHDFIGKGRDTAATLRQQRQDSRKTTEDEITARRDETKGVFSQLRASAQTKANAALAKVQKRYTQTVAQVEVKFVLSNLALLLGKMIAQPKLEQALTTELTTLDDVYTTGYDNLIDGGEAMGLDAQDRAAKHSESYKKAEGASADVQYRVQNKVKDGFWDGYLTYNRYKARADSAKEIGKQYKEGMEKQAKTQADDMLCGKSVDIDVVNKISAEGIKTLGCVYDNAVNAVKRQREAALMQALHAYQKLTKAINDSLTATQTQLREREGAQLQLIKDYGIRQAMAIERDSSTAINSVVTGVTEAASKVLEVLTNFSTESKGMLAPSPLALKDRISGMKSQINSAIDQASGAVNSSAAGTETHVDNNTSKTKTSISQLCIEGLTSAYQLWATFDESIDTLNANTDSTFDTLSTTVLEAIDGETTNGTTQMTAIVTAITDLYTKLNGGLSKRFADALVSMRIGMQKSLNDDFDNKICTEAEKAAADVQPWWKTVLKILLIIVVIVVVIVVAGPAIIAAVGGLAASAAGALGASVALAGTIGAWVGAVVGGAIVGALSGAVIQVGNNLIDAIGNGPLTWDKVTKGVWGAIVAGAIGGALGGLGGKFAQLLIGRLATAGIAAGYQTVARYGVELAFDAVGSVLGDLANGNPITLEGIVKGAVIGIIVQKSMGGLGRYAKSGKQATTAGKQTSRLERLAMNIENIQSAAAAKGESAGAKTGSKLGGKSAEWTGEALKTAREAEVPKQPGEKPISKTEEAPPAKPTKEEAPPTKPVAEEAAPTKPTKEEAPAKTPGATEEPTPAGGKKPQEEAVDPATVRQDADTIPEASVKDLKGANRFKTADGHDVTVTKDGPMLRCSDPCELIEIKYKDLIDANPEIARDIRMAKDFAETNQGLSRAKAQDAIDTLTALRNLEVADKLHGVVKDPAARTGLAKLANRNNAAFDDLLAKLRTNPDELTNMGKFLNDNPDFAAQMGDKWPPALMKEVIDNPELLQIMRTNAHDPELMNDLWNDFTAHRSPSKQLKSNFQEYVGRSGYSVGVKRTRTKFTEEQADTIADLKDRLKKLSSLDETAKAASTQQIQAKSRALQLDILATTEPDLAAMIRNGTVPENLQAAVNNALNDPRVLFGRTHVEHARSGIMSDLNEAIGRNIADIKQFGEIISVVNQPSSRGAIGEAYANQKKIMGDNKLQQRVIKVDDLPNMKNAELVKPDEISVTDAGGRTIDVKTGYETGKIDMDQLENYWQLHEQSQVTGSVANRRLAAMGIPGGKLTGHDYLFLPGPTKAGAPAAKAIDAAKATFIKIQKLKYAKIVDIYYVDAAGVRRKFTAADL